MALQKPSTTTPVDTIPTAVGELYANDVYLDQRVSQITAGFGPAVTASFGTTAGTIAEGAALTAEIARAQAAEGANATALGTKAPLDSPALTGTPTAPTAAAGALTNQVATTAFATSAVSVEQSRAQAAETALQNTLNTKASASDLLGVAQDTLTALGGKLDKTGDASGTSVVPAGGTRSSTLAAFLGQTVRITDFMTAGSTDITTALGLAEAKLGAAGGRILFPSSNSGYTQTAKHQFPSNIRCEGEGRTAAIITTNFDGDVWAFGDGATTNQNCSVENITFRSSITRTQGGAIALAGAYNFHARNVTGDVNCYVLIEVRNGPNAFKIHLDRIFAIGTPYAGIRVGFGGAADATMPADVFISDCLTSGATRAGLELVNVNGIQIRGGDHINAAVGMLIDPGNGQKVAAVQTTDGFLDTSVNAGLKIAPTGTGVVADSTFSGLWGATNGQTTGAPGVLVQGTATSVRSLTFNAPRLFNNGGEGIRVEGGAYIDINAPQIGFNSTTTAATYSGIYFAAGVSNWSVVGGRSGAGTGFTQTNQQKYGLEIAAGAGDAFSVAGADLTGNVTGALSNGATGANQTVIARGVPFGFTGGKFGVGTMTPNNNFTAIGASRPLTDASAGGALAQLSTGTGANTDNALLFGVQDATLGWIQAIKAGSQTLRLHLNGTGGAVALGAPSPAITEAKNFPYAPVMAGAPTGTPNAITGMAPFVIDSTNSKLWAYVNGSWKSTALA